MLFDRAKLGIAGFIVMAGVLACPAVSFAAAVTLPYSQTFNTPTSDVSSTYPEFTSSGGTASVDAGGVVHIPTGDIGLSVTPSPAPTGEVVILAQIGATLSDGNFNVGLTIGQNHLVFHPGYAGPPAGAFRIEGPGGFGNSDMGFVPANGALHQFEVHSFPNGDFTIKVTDANNPANVYNAAFNNPASYGTDIGFWRSGPTTEQGIYDNLQISVAPEPGMLGLIGMGSLGLLGRRRRA